MKQVFGGFAAGILLFLVGCASHSAWHECETHLVPINTPAPASSSGSHP